MFVLPMEALNDMEMDRMFDFGDAIKQVMLTCGMDVIVFQIIHNHDLEFLSLHELFTVQIGNLTRRMIIGLDFNFIVPL